MTLTWDPWNRLAYTSLSGTTTGYSYDQSGQRVTQAVNYGSGTTTTTYFSKLFQKTGATTTLYVYLPNGELLATVEGNGSATTTNIAHTDHLNSTHVMSNSGGVLHQLVTTHPYGSLRNDEYTTLDTANKFIGQKYDRALAMSYLQARYLLNANGQFISQDPMFLGDPGKQRLSDPQQLNSYNYASNNPINGSDPLGLFDIKTGYVNRGDTTAGIASIINSRDGTSYTYKDVMGWAGITNPTKLLAGSTIDPRKYVTSTFSQFTNAVKNTVSLGGIIPVGNSSVVGSSPANAAGAVFGSVVNGVQTAGVLVASLPAAAVVGAARAKVFNDLGIQAGAKALRGILPAISDDIVLAGQISKAYGLPKIVEKIIVNSTIGAAAITAIDYILDPTLARD